MGVSCIFAGIASQECTRYFRSFRALMTQVQGHSEILQEWIFSLWMLWSFSHVFCRKLKLTSNRWKRSRSAFRMRNGEKRSERKPDNISSERITKTDCHGNVTMINSPSRYTEVILQWQTLSLRAINHSLESRDASYCMCLICCTPQHFFQHVLYVFVLNQLYLRYNCTKVMSPGGNWHKFCINCHAPLPHTCSVQQIGHIDGYKSHISL